MSTRRGDSDDHADTLDDVRIVGGGPAGLSAAIWLGRYLHKVALVDSGDPRNWETRGINGYLGLPGIRPAQLRGVQVRLVLIRRGDHNEGAVAILGLAHGTLIPYSLPSPRSTCWRCVAVCAAL